MSARDELAAVAELGALPMPTGEPMPVELTEQQIEALIDAGNGALSDYYHERQCHCWDYPAGCVTNPQFRRSGGFWDTDAFAIGLPAVLGVWELLRNDRHAAKVAELRADNERLRARVAELETLKPARFQDCQECGTGYEYGKPCSFCEFKARIAAEIAKAQAEVTPDQARRIERDHPETNTTHNCTLPLSRRLDCGHCPHEVCPDCQRCPHTCRCASPEVTR